MTLNQLIIPFLFTLLAGLSTVIGSLIFLSRFFCRKKFTGFFFGLSAGVMIYLSFAELLAEATETLGFLPANLWFFIGIIVMALIDVFIPHHYLERKLCCRYKIVDTQSLSTGIMVTIALMIHNFPEGIAVFLSSFGDIKFGLLLAIAIAIHNIPEGIAVAVPIYRATQSRRQAVKYAFISGMAEPVGAVISYLLLKDFLSQNFIAYIFALVAGIMTYISFDELLPACFEHKYKHYSILGITMGMLVVAISLIFL